jgi:hypothetical protein
MAKTGKREKLRSISDIHRFSHRNETECFTPAIRHQARDYARRFGAEPTKLGYRGYFELDVLVDEDSGKAYLGEVNPPGPVIPVSRRQGGSNTKTRNSRLS